MFKYFWEQVRPQWVSYLHHVVCSNHKPVPYRDWKATDNIKTECPSRPVDMYNLKKRKYSFAFRYQCVRGSRFFLCHYIILLVWVSEGHKKRHRVDVTVVFQVEWCDILNENRSTIYKWTTWYGMIKKILTAVLDYLTVKNHYMYSQRNVLQAKL